MDFFRFTLSCGYSLTLVLLSQLREKWRFDVIELTRSKFL